MSFEKNLRRIRTELGIDQVELARRLNVSQRTISSWETGRTQPNMGTMADLCKALHCTVEDLAGVRTREVGAITYEDVVVFINDLDLKSLVALNDIIDRRIKTTIEVGKLEKEKRDMELRIKAYEEQIRKLQHED